MALGDVIARLAVNLTMETAAFEEGATVAEKRLAQSAKRIDQLGQRMTALGGKLSIAVTAPLGAFGVAALNAASDAAELQGSFDQTFGDMSETMNEWAQTTGDALGRSTREMQQAANTFGIFFNTAVDKRKAAEMSQVFASLAQDLGSFYNVDTETAIEKLRSGLSGESEPLRDFGVFLTEASVQSKALEMGLASSSKELTEQDKILARYNLILAATTNAQGDVERTSGGTANQARAAAAAFEELQVTVGTKLLPVITPLITKVADLLNAFSRLPDGVQTFVVGGAAVAAALGPIIAGIGGIVSAGSTMIAALGSIGASMASVGTIGGAAQVGVAALGGALTALGPIVAIVAGVAAAGYLIYENWDKIAPVLESLWATVQETLGPPLQALVSAVSTALTALWEGPLGSLLKSADGALAGFGGTVAKVLGVALVEAVKLAAIVIGGLISQIADGISLVTSLFQGDWTKAWQLAGNIVNRAFGGLPDYVIGLMNRLVTGVRTWVVDRLGAVWNTVTDKIDTVRRAFFGLYDAVVGHSYIPDMVDGIATQMARLDAEMVKPADQAAVKIENRFEALAEKVQALTAKLFPEVAQRAEFRASMDTIDSAEAAGMYTPEVATEARNRVLEQSGATEGVNDIINYGGLTTAANDNAKAVDAANRRLGASFETMAEQALGSLRSLTDGIKSGDILGILGSTLSLVGSLIGGATGTTLGNLGGALNNGLGRYAVGTPSAPRGLALVGERGPELVNFSGGERVYRNADTEAMMNGRGGGETNYFSYTLPSQEFWGRVDNLAAGRANTAVVRERQTGVRKRSRKLGKTG